MNINSIHGGQAEQADDFTGLPAHCVPDSCRIVIDRRFLVEETLDDVRDEVESLLNELKVERPNFEYDMREINSVLPSMTDREAPIAASVAKQIEIVMGKPAEFGVSWDI
jgi:succinyl-diaminopimelate desuccinylase